MIRVGLLWQREPCEVFAAFEGPGISINIKCPLPCLTEVMTMTTAVVPIVGKEFALIVHWYPCYQQNPFNRWRDKQGRLWPNQGVTVASLSPHPHHPYICQLPSMKSWNSWPSQSLWFRPLAGDFKHSHSEHYFLWLLWPPPLCSLFLDLQKCQNGQVSVTGSWGLWNNSSGMCNSECLKGSAFTEPRQDEWTANPLIQWNLFLMLRDPRGQGEATATTLPHAPFPPYSHTYQTSPAQFPQWQTSYLLGNLTFGLLQPQVFLCHLWEPWRYWNNGTHRKGSSASGLYSSIPQSAIIFQNNPNNLFHRLLSVFLSS